MPDTIQHHHDRPDTRRRDPPRTMRRLARNIWLTRDWVNTVFNCVEELAYEDYEDYCPSAMYRVVIHYFRRRSTFEALLGVSSWEWALEIAPMDFAEQIVEEPDFLQLLEAFSQDHECAYAY